MSRRNSRSTAQAELGLEAWFDLDLPPATSEGLRRAQDDLVEGAASGTRCPCCGHLVKVYSTRFDAGMARTVIWMVQAWEARQPPEGAPAVDRWIEPAKEAPRHVLRSRKLGRIEHWGLIEARPGLEDPKKRHQGQWRPTREGVRFANDQATIPVRVYFYRNRVVGTSRERIGVREALGSGFDYEELMRARPEFRRG